MYVIIAKRYIAPTKEAYENNPEGAVVPFPSKTTAYGPFPDTFIATWWALHHLHGTTWEFFKLSPPDKVWMDTASHSLENGANDEGIGLLGVPTVQPVGDLLDTHTNPINSMHQPDEQGG